jgi:uncharacterized protein (DUF1015 family)
MSLVVPIRALRPAKPFASHVTSPPYDVMNCEEARRFVRGNPLSFLHVEKSEIDVDDEFGKEDQQIYDRAKANLSDLIDRKIILLEEAPVFYVYRLQLGERIQTGIVAGVSLDEYREGRIKQHELTRNSKEKERTRHIDTVGAQTGLIFLTYHGREPIGRLTAKVTVRSPEYNFTASDGVVHTVWIIKDADEIRQVIEEFAPIDSLYIADGHHRAAAAATVSRIRRERNPHDRGDEDKDLLMAVLFPQDEVRIMAYNRVVNDLNGLTVETLLDRIGEEFLITEDFAAKSPSHRHEFGMYMDGKWRLLKARDSILRDEDPVAGLDVSLLQENLLGPILGVHDPRKDARIGFVGGIRGMSELERLVDRGGYAVAFSLYPTTVGEMMAVADAGKVMPPKSTWFEPKLLSGLFIYPLE